MWDGIFGQSDSTYIINCNNRGNITNSNSYCNFGNYRVWTGGIGGECNFGNINGCYNIGNVNVNNNNSILKDKFIDHSFAGGIVGSANFDDCYGTTKISNCYNKGNISSSFEVDRIGGIAGSATELNKEAATIEKCYNSGKIECSNSLDKSLDNKYASNNIGRNCRKF